MSRIDEALRQAGLRQGSEGRAAAVPAGLDSFPEGSESVQAEPPRDVSEPAVKPVRAPQPQLVQPHVAQPQVTQPQAPQPNVSQPHVPPPHTPRDIKSLAVEKLVIHDETGRACVEQYRRVAALLHQLQEGRGTKVIMVASTQPGEGKTLTAANLALTLSESYRRRVLLIDADLRRPSLHTLFRLPSASGLSDRLKGHGQGPLKVMELSDRLALLPGGSPDTDPMAGLTSGRMTQIIDQASATYDWIILDTPPVALQPDAGLLGGMVDATIFVIGAGTTGAAAIQHAIETIGREKIVGVVLNRIDDSQLDEAAYYNYYYNTDKARPGGAQLSGL